MSGRGLCGGGLCPEEVLSEEILYGGDYVSCVPGEDCQDVSRVLFLIDPVLLSVSHKRRCTLLLF